MSTERTQEQSIERASKVLDDITAKLAAMTPEEHAAEEAINQRVAGTLQQQAANKRELDTAVRTSRQSYASIVAKEAHAAYISAVQRAFPDRKVSKVAHVVYFDDPKLPIIMVASDPGTTMEQCASLLATAAKTLKIQEPPKSTIDKEEEILP